jgi:hypothetical protein
MPKPSISYRSCEFAARAFALENKHLGDGPISGRALPGYVRDQDQDQDQDDDDQALADQDQDQDQDQDDGDFGGDDTDYA